MTRISLFILVVLLLTGLHSCQQQQANNGQKPKAPQVLAYKNSIK